MANKYAATAAVAASERKFKDNTHKLYDRRKLWQERKTERNAAKKQVWVYDNPFETADPMTGHWERV